MQPHRVIIREKGLGEKTAHTPAQKHIARKVRIGNDRTPLGGGGSETNSQLARSLPYAASFGGGASGGSTGGRRSPGSSSIINAGGGGDVREPGRRPIPFYTP